MAMFAECSTLKPSLKSLRLKRTKIKKVSLRKATSRKRSNYCQRNNSWGNLKSLTIWSMPWVHSSMQARECRLKSHAYSNLGKIMSSRVELARFTSWSLQETYLWHHPIKVTSRASQVLYWAVVQLVQMFSQQTLSPHFQEDPLPICKN